MQYCDMVARASAASGGTAVRRKLGVGRARARRAATIQRRRAVRLFVRRYGRPTRTLRQSTLLADRGRRGGQGAWAAAAAGAVRAQRSAGVAAVVLGVGHRCERRSAMTHVAAPAQRCAPATRGGGGRRGRRRRPAGATLVLGLFCGGCLARLCSEPSPRALRRRRPRRPPPSHASQGLRCTRSSSRARCTRHADLRQDPDGCAAAPERTAQFWAVRIRGGRSSAPRHRLERRR